MKQFSRTGLDWESRGYFGAPVVPPDVAIPDNPMRNPWLVLSAAIAGSKSGNFSRIPLLMDICTLTEDSLLAATCSEVLGDAGGPDCFNRLVEQLSSIDRFETALNCCRALHMGGRLSDVPAMLNVYAKFVETNDVDIIPVWISDLIGKDDNESLLDPPHHEDLEDYLEAVHGRYREVLDQCGTEAAYVFRAARFGVEELGRYILDRFQQPFVRSYLRQKFEASTGVDCTNFYRKGEFRSLAASAIVEEFLESGVLADYEEGQRYFFSHPIPD